MAKDVTPLNATNWCFPAETESFLRDLRDNNNRDWFVGQKSVYEAVYKNPAQAFCAIIENELATLTGLAHKSKIFRINRDLRFSKDKTPYNTHLHISFLPDGAGQPAWFFGLEPDQLVLGTGVFAFEKLALDGFRHRIAGPEGGVLAKLVSKLEASGARLHEPELKRVPSGYPQDHPQAEMLRRKGLAAWYAYPDTSPITSPEAIASCMATFAMLKPMFDWLRKGAS